MTLAVKRVVVSSPVRMGTPGSSTLYFTTYELTNSNSRSSLARARPSECGGRNSAAFQVQVGLETEGPCPAGTVLMG